MVADSSQGLRTGTGATKWKLLNVKSRQVLPSVLCPETTCHALDVDSQPIEAWSHGKHDG